MNQTKVWEATIVVDGPHEPGTCGYLNHIGFHNPTPTGEVIGYGGIRMLLAQYEGRRVRVTVTVEEL